MNALLRTFISSIAFAVITTGSASGQAAKVTAEKPAFDDIQSPEFTGGKQKGFKPKDWLEIETKIKVQLSPEPKSKTCDRLTSSGMWPSRIRRKPEPCCCSPRTSST